MEYPTPDGVWCRSCGHGYWQYPDRHPRHPFADNPWCVKLDWEVEVKS